MKKIMVTGGSGFIGTNLVEELIKREYEVINIDASYPKNKEHMKVYKKIDLLNKDVLYNCMMEFSPDTIIHLAARTDLNGKTLEDYYSNTVGTSNIIECANAVKTVKKVVFTSSMLVCRFGYNPTNQKDYCPSTLYGESKAQMERIIWESDHNYEWVIIRPTSIWGPWFGEPYRDFFDFILGRKYIHIGSKSATCTYGYVGNAIEQILALAKYDPNTSENKVFYIGDYEPNNLEKWANEISAQVPYHILKVPYFIVKLAAWFGDALKLINIRFPMTSFRLNNMTSNYILDMSETEKVLPKLPFSRLQGVKVTVEWIRNNETKR